MIIILKERLRHNVNVAPTEMCMACGPVFTVNSPQVLCELADQVRFLLFDIIHDSIVGIADLNP